MIIHVTGVSTRNKGAELMLVAIRQHYSALGAGVDLAVDPWFGTYNDRARYGLWTKLVSGRLGRSSIAMRLMPLSFRTLYGLVADRDVGVVLDASGFAFGDQLGPLRSEQFARNVRCWKDQRKPVVLLPQALGPFENARVRRAFTDILSLADLVYARDRLSYEYCHGLNSNARNLRLAPDFTNLVSGKCPPDFRPPSRMACIVPNHRMVEKGTTEARAAYIPLLAKCTSELRHRGLRPVILLHDADVDESLVAPLQELMSEPIPVIRESDPCQLKGILGCAQIVAGSRFHALVGALSQAIPCIGIGWSHKYEKLFEDYECPECLLPATATFDQLRKVIDRTFIDPHRSDLVARLQSASSEQMQRTRELWSEVDTLLGLEVSSSPQSVPDSPQNRPSVTPASV